MKLQLLLLPLYILFSYKADPSSLKEQKINTEMEFTLLFSSKERSRDSRSSLIKYQLQNTTLSQNTRYKGSRAKPSTEEKVLLNSQQLEQLANIIQTLELNINYEKSCSSNPKSNSGIIRYYESIFSYTNSKIKVIGDQAQKENAKAKILREFEYLLKYLLKGDVDLFNKRYQKIIEN